MIDVGNPATDRVQAGPGTYTVIQKDNPANASGMIDHIEIYTTNTGEVEVASFFLVSGTNFSSRASSGPLQLAAGLNVFDAPGDFTAFAIEAGDYIGIFPDRPDRDTNGGGNWYRSGDNIPVTNQQFTSHNACYSLFATGAESGPVGALLKTILHNGG